LKISNKFTSKINTEDPDPNPDPTFFENAGSGTIYIVYGSETPVGVLA